MSFKFKRKKFWALQYNHEITITLTKVMKDRSHKNSHPFSFRILKFYPDIHFVKIFTHLQVYLFMMPLSNGLLISKPQFTMRLEPLPT
ncbi:hypothetical protein HanRHA438_Chr08g0340581 [Helianthus annuus]|uniref:Uncharacterized protein n=1 Tax=Helianthus annuus TaxID=4232 RepID=A0A9K3IDB6_HELAN|nr:hypothetical protein HanXRQr2_Chr08g0329321 [Helianthus annuus]KAJ0545970.1 hypothetical protein HanIR_Chr08g0355661 [Helianthus annuus]KAJ0896981.1 hypothetical protein HanRHA438_Chr08g0340581 [Helianthus annuus]KAJ0900851.1 hypothetical protein HanPSC8_Chr08g0318441 [Helianthus annuus]